MTAILGIVNLTQDSFSDAGQFVDSASSVSHALALIEQGATAIDLGPSSSHPGAPIVPSSIEIERLAPVFDVLLPLGIPLSVDSFHTETQRYAISRGVAFLNDIHGFPHPDFYPELAEATCRLIVMHSIHGMQPTGRVVTDPAKIISRIIEFFYDRVEALTRSGIAPERLILDPGMGFFLSSEPEASIVVLQHLSQIRREFNLPLLVGASRKSFIQRITGQLAPNAGAGTLSAELFAASQSVDWIRTHNVEALSDALLIQARLRETVSYTATAMV